MGILRTASTATKDILLDETDYIKVRADLSKRDFNDLVTHMPQGVEKDGTGLSLADATKFQEYLFGALVVGWSLDVPATVEEYNNLSADAGQAIDAKLGEHFESLLPTSAEGK
jgi:tRNA isopentenyl-2-thiomethyl-A-37 hydroxylase MiaE